MMLPENAPVRLVSAQLEELDYRKLYEAYSPIGRKSAADPRVMFKKMCPERTLRYIRTDRTAEGHEVKVRYIGTIVK